MSQDREAVRAALASLRSQLTHSEEVSPSLRASLLETLKSLEAAVDEPQSQQPTTLKARLTEAVLEFEESHPNLARALDGVVDALSTIGI
jgi:hypothetical protein